MPSVIKLENAFYDSKKKVILTTSVKEQAAELMQTPSMIFMPNAVILTRKEVSESKIEDVEAKFGVSQEKYDKLQNLYDETYKCCDSKDSDIKRLENLCNKKDGEIAELKDAISGAKKEKPGAGRPKGSKNKDK